MQPGTVIGGRYRIEEELGSGGQGVVFRATHIELDVGCAVKVLVQPGLAARERLLREGRAQAALHHPNVVRVTDVVEHGDAVALVMDLVSGPTLRDVITERAPLSLAWIAT